MRTRGFTLIEQMIVVAMLSILLAGGWSIRGVLREQGSPGESALRVRQATEMLVQARQDALVEPLALGGATLRGRHPAIEIRRRVEPAGPGLLRVTLEARWEEGNRSRRLSLVTARALP